MSAKDAKTVASKMGLDTVYKPTITLDKSLYPDVDKLKVDDVVNLNVKVKITNVSRDQYGGNQLHVSGTIENAEDEDNEDSED